MRQLKVITTRRYRGTDALKHTRLHIIQIIQLILGIVVEGLVDLCIKLIKIKVPHTWQRRVEGLVHAEIQRVGLGRGSAPLAQV